jgi:hypothetical protein
MREEILMSVRIVCEEFKPFRRNTLVGFAVLLLPDLGLRIRECPVHRQGDRRWIGFPGRQWTDQQGNKQWANLIEFLDGVDREAFQTGAVEAIRSRIAAPAADKGSRRRPYPEEANV